MNEDFRNWWKDEFLRVEFMSAFDDVSEPLHCYSVALDDAGTLTDIRPPYLLGVKKNGKWGYVDIHHNFVIEPQFDNGFGICYNGILVNQKNGNYGGIYIETGKIAFSFVYQWLGFTYNDTYVARKGEIMCALLKPGDVKLTDFNYLGITNEIHNGTAGYLRKNWLGNYVKGRIDLNTGKELS